MIRAVAGNDGYLPRRHFFFCQKEFFFYIKAKNAVITELAM